jgi:hypothetical protein
MAQVPYRARVVVGSGVMIPFFWAGVLAGDALLVGMHVLMLPAMVIAMVHRRSEYAQGHCQHHATIPAR